MERRLAVHAGDDAQALTRRGHRRSCAIALVLVSIAGTADARPRRGNAKAAFDRGLAAYKKGDFAAASEALGKSFALERDVDTLYAWAQAERKLEHCDKASTLYVQLLGFDLPKENREAVESNLAECRLQIAQQAATVEPAPGGAAPVEPAPAAPSPSPAGPDVENPLGPSQTPAVSVSASASASRAWYRDPVALALVGGGVVAGSVGGGLLLSARSLDRDYHAAANLEAARPLSERAQSRETLGLVAAGAGGALVVGGVVWIMLHRRGEERPGAGATQTVTGWLAPAGGGLAIAGSF